MLRFFELLYLGLGADKSLILSVNGEIIIIIIIIFCEYFVEKTKRNKKLTYGTKVEGVSFPKHGGKDEDNGERMRMQP